MSVNYDESWELAETTVFDALVDAASSTADKNAFKGYLPAGGYNMWMLLIGGGGSAEQTWNITPSRCWMDARIEGLYSVRSTAQQTALLLLQGLPIERSQNVEIFRLKSNGMPKVEPVPDESGHLFWHMTILCEIVFATTTTFTE